MYNIMITVTWMSYIRSRSDRSVELHANAFQEDDMTKIIHE